MSLTSSSFVANVTQAVHEALVLFLPLHCAGCEKPDVVVCDDCIGQIECNVQYREVYLAEQRIRLPLFYCTELVEPLTRIIQNFKDAGYTATKKVLADVMRNAVRELAAKNPTALWVFPPSPRHNVRTRGYHPVKILARECGIHTSPLLVNASGRKDQRALGKIERKKNLYLSMRASRDLSGHSVIIIDDIMTTGATLEESARALITAGAQVVAAIVLAHAPRKFSDNLQANQVTEGGHWD